MRIVVGRGSCGIAAGAGKVYSALEALIANGAKAELGSTGCIGTVSYTHLTLPTKA